MGYVIYVIQWQLGRIWLNYHSHCSPTSKNEKHNNGQNNNKANCCQHFLH